MRLVRYRGFWCAAWHDGTTTRRRSLRTKDRDEAERRFADLQRDNARQGDATVSAVYAAYVNDLAARGKPQERAIDAWKRLGEWFGAKRPDQITKDLCRLYVASRRRDGVSDGTTRTELGYLKSAVLSDNKRSPADFELPAASPPRDRYLTQDEYVRLRDAAGSAHVRLFIILALGTAARKTAVLQLQWSQIDFDAGLIDMGAGVGNKRRAVVPMTKTVRQALEEAYTVRTCAHVVEYAGKPIGKVDAAFKRAVRRAGIDACSPHDLRRSAARWMAEAGASMSEIAAYLGHNDSRTTERVYARFSPNYLRNAAQALEI